MEFEPILTEYQGSLYDSYVESAEAYKIGNKTTVILLKLFNGFEIVGTSACVDPDNFDMKIGAQYALVDALYKLDGFVGFLRQETKFYESQTKDGE